MRDPLLRLLSLLDTPADIPFLTSMAERELLHRLLRGPQGRLLRRMRASPKARWRASGERPAGSGTVTTPACASRHCVKPVA
ncbi:AraC family transcriptional regulator N-terminal domain-containing protein [Janthinobacterium sp. RB2R34]|uniref:AraC family transcriptional regulator N-terminal domain-containing protein n=1 Tax=Janthinobacterium sp. RB2R34 TaxID=3424193 RepID=UPI003F244118